MANQEYSTNNHQDDAVEHVSRIIEGDTYSISDNESTTNSVDLIDTNTVKLEGELNHSISQDSLTNGEQNKIESPSSRTNSKISSKMSTIKSTATGNGLRSLALDEHIKLVKQKKEEAEILRLQKFQEQLRKKEQKWQQQQVERVKKWLQLRNRDGDHRLQVEERRKKREEEAKAKIDELLRREKEREQRVNHTRTTKPDTVMTMSTDILSTRRAISASRFRSNNQDKRILNESPEENSTTRDEVINPSILTNGDSQRRMPSANRQHLSETVRRLAKPRNMAMTQSIHIGASSSSSNGIPLSRSSHQIRLTTPPVATTSSATRRHAPSRPATVPTSATQSRTPPSDDSSSTNKSSHRPTTHSKLPSSSTKPPTLSSRSKPATQRSLMTTSHSSSSLSSSATTSSKHRPPPPLETQSVIQTTEEEENVPVIEESISSMDTATEITPPPKREQQILDEQEYQRKLNQKIREAQQRLEIERQREEERQRQVEFEENEREQEQILLVEEQRRVEQERLQRAIEERERENELKRQEEQRLQQQREEFERKQAEETERLNRERQERTKKEEEERNERKKRLDLIMRRTRQISPNSKQENNPNKPILEQTNGHDPINNIPHSRFPTSSSTDNFLLNNDSIASTTDTPKFKSPLIQSLLNKARNTRSTDNLVQTSLTASQIMTESMIVESITAGELPIDNDHQENSRINNGHSDLHLSSRPMETATAFQ